MGILSSSSKNDTSFLEQTLIRFSESETWTIRDAVRGVQIFGGIGSGKTSGSGKTIAKTFLKSGFGGLVLCAKPDEAKDWIAYAEESGRSHDIIRFCEGSPYKFNPLQYETSRSGQGAGLTYNLTELFMTVFKMGQRISGSDAEEKERFWDNSLKRCINRIIDLLKLCKEDISIFNMVELLSSSPTDSKTLEAINTMEDEEILNWGKSNFCIKCLYQAGENAATPNENRDYDLVFNFFLRDFANLDERVQSTIKEMFLGFAEPFLSGILNDHFATVTNITPEVTFDGKIIIMDFSVKNYLVAGIYAQCLFKYLWQQAVERRPVSENTLPVFLWVDESQYFINEYDTIFQTTARSSRACTVLLTQNISNYYAQMGGKSAVPKVDSLLGNLATKIFHSNNDAITNEYASRLIGEDVRALESGGRSDTFLSIKSTSNHGYSMQLLPQVFAREFTVLRSGGEEHDFKVESIILVSGKKWADGKNFKKAFFNQK